MKIAIKSTMIGVAACAFAAPAFAYTINATIPCDTRKMHAVHLQKPPAGATTLKLTLSAPPGGGVAHTINFCIALASAPALHPCPSNETEFIIVPNQQTVVFVDAGLYPHYVIWAGTGTTLAVPLTVDVDLVP
jgi:hypothetical protein